jgi:hypothetical protein
MRALWEAMSSVIPLWAETTTSPPSVPRGVSPHAWRYLLPTLLPLMLGCSAPPLEGVFARHANAEHLHYRVFIDPSFPPEVIPVIEEALTDWQVSLRSLVEFQITIEHSDCSSGERTICINLAQHGELHDGQAGETDYSGKPDRSLLRISADNFSPDVANWRECTRITTTHELGHVMGLRHDRAGTIMSFKGTYVARYITDTDVRQFFRVHGIR